MNFPDRIKVEEKQISRHNTQIISKTEDMTLKKVPLVELINQMKEVKEFLPALSSL